MKKPRLPRAIIVVVLLLGVGAAGVGLWLLLDEVVFAMRATRAEGTVQSKRGGSRGEESRSAGVPVRVVAENRSADYLARAGWSRLKNGQAVTILFVPGEPESARLDGFAERYLLPLVLLLFGGVLLAAFLWDRRQRRRFHEDVHDRDRLTPAMWKRW